MSYIEPPAGWGVLVSDDVAIATDGVAYWVDNGVDADGYWADNVLFVDGFESGDLSGWSAVVQ